jgi:Tfp pilus assembly protein PilE
MNGMIIVAIITVLGSIIAAAITSYLTKAKDREAEWRSVKLAHYKRFMTALSAIVGSSPTPEERITFADAASAACARAWTNVRSCYGRLAICFSPGRGGRSCAVVPAARNGLGFR